MPPVAVSIIMGFASLPSSLKEIGALAFMLCTSLRKIVIPANVEKVGEQVFTFCKNIYIYCKVKSKPSGWNSNWYGDCVYYNGKYVFNCGSKSHSCEKDLIAITPATCTTVGEKIYKCIICDQSSSVEISIIDHNYVNGYCINCSKEE